MDYLSSQQVCPHLSLQQCLQQESSSAAARAIVPMPKMSATERQAIVSFMMRIPFLVE
jgi:hypothetical protein